MYEDAHGNLFSVPLQLYGYNPLEVTLNVYESQGGRALEYIDDWGKVFLKLMREQVQSLTWRGIPISQQRIRVHGPSTLGSTDPFFPSAPSAVPSQVEMEVPPFPYNTVGRMSSMENLCGSMSHINLGETARNFQTGPVPSHMVTGISALIDHPPKLLVITQAKEFLCHKENLVFLCLEQSDLE